MRNAIGLITKYIYQHIPNEVLVEAFSPHRENRSLDAIIKEQVIIDYVMAQANLVAGRTKKIELRVDWVKDTDDTDVSHFMMSKFAVYQIPPEARENRPITLVIDLSYPAYLAYGTSLDQDGSVANLNVANRADEMLSSFTQSPNNLTPQPVLLDGANGIVRLDPPMSIHTDWVLSCALEFDQNLTGVSQNLIPLLQKMTLYATQAICYNKLWIRLNQGQLVGGQQLEAMRNIVEEYREAQEKFDEALLKFRGGSMFARDTLNNYISLMVGS